MVVVFVFSGYKTTPGCSTLFNSGLWSYEGLTRFQGSKHLTQFTKHEWLSSVIIISTPQAKAAHGLDLNQYNSFESQLIVINHAMILTDL